MSLLLPRDAIAARRAVAAGPLAALADGLAAELEPVVERALCGELHPPAEKALLSRVGGRCEDDGELLEFDPWSPHEHRCPRCGRVWRGDWHDRFWPYWYQLWLAERAVHAALLWRLRGDARHLTLARRLLDAYAGRYLGYPNRDNVLGPSRPFFSTYLESIWLLQLCVAGDLLVEADDARERDANARVVDRLRERVVEPSERLIASYDEGASNRQVWNNAALIAARTLLGRRDPIESRLHGDGGVLAHLEGALLVDGTWYEGENYHLFAHRGLWYAVTMAETAGVELPAEARRRFREGFAAPFLTALPDFTLPARRDSQWAIALRQPRFAELCELGLARGDDERLVGALARLYDGETPRADTGRARSTADVERNGPATGLGRADVGWRALLHARPELPVLTSRAPRSVLLEGQGLAVFRRDEGRRYVAIDYGHSGGGHGHPDRLNLLVADGDTRWLDDMGTGSYVERALHWYRSSLAHNAPFVDGHSQRRANGRLRAHEERGGAGWICADAEPSPGVLVRRTVVVMPGYLLDRLQWSADRDVTLDLPLHVDGHTADAAWRPATLEGGSSLEDGFDFVRDAERTVLPHGRPLHLCATEGGEASLDLHLIAPASGEWWRAVAPGPPGTGHRRFHLLRARGESGRFDLVWSFDGTVRDVSADVHTTTVDCADGSRQVHGATEDGWQVKLEAGAARSSIDLGGLRRVASAVSEQRAPESGVAPLSLRIGPTPDDWLGDHVPAGDDALRRFELGEGHYRRSEEGWAEAGGPTATVSLASDGRALDVEADVRTTTAPRFVPRDADNPYDNEPAEVNGDGVQLYVSAGARAGAWLLVPEEDGGVRARRVAGWSELELDGLRWRPTPRGYTLRARVLLPSADFEGRVGVDLLVNETAPGRARRRGQLVLSGGGGFVYLRGDRQERELLLPLRLEPA